MKNVALGIVALLAVAAICLMPAGADAAGDIYHSGKDIIKTSASEEFEIKYTLSEGDEGKTITYEAKVVDKAGTTMTNAVTPASGSLDNGVYKKVTVTAPSTPGNYSLVVTYFLKSSESGAEPVKDSEKSYNFVVVNPIKLTVNLEAKDVTLSLEEFGVYFYIDNVKQDDSYTTVTLSANGTGSVTYEWVANPEPNSVHEFYVQAVDSSDLIKGLGEVHTFYANDNDYSLIITIAFITLIILIVVFVWVYRKPVKNFGKPKSRR
jgi:hypothetical protein